MRKYANFFLCCYSRSEGLSESVRLKFTWFNADTEIPFWSLSGLANRRVSWYHLFQAQMSNAFGIRASNIFQQIARQFMNVTSAQKENRLRGPMLSPGQGSGKQETFEKVAIQGFIWDLWVSKTDKLLEIGKWGWIKGKYISPYLGRGITPSVQPWSAG